MLIPIMTLLANTAILLNIPILRYVIVFIFLTFIPGFAILRLFKLKETSLLDTFLFSIGLSIAFVMFMGLLVNELYLFLGFSKPLSVAPLTIAISAFTLCVFLFEYKRDLSENLKSKTSFEGKLKDFFPLSIILILLPILSAIGVLYLNVSLILLSEAIIAALCVISVVSGKIVPEKLFPFLIFSISIALICQVLLTSKYILGYDANIEYYVFRLTQINGHWGFLNANVNLLVTLTYNSMLSLTLLPAVYSTLMNAQGDLVFKILYPFIFLLIPLIIYRICEKQLGKLIGLLSALFFVFTSTAFYGVEALDLNRQIVGELFLFLSVFLLIIKTIPVTKRRLLLIIFGAALVVSHYALEYIFLAIVALVFIIARIKPRFDDTLNTVTVLLLFVITFSWYTLTSAPLEAVIGTFHHVFVNLSTGAKVTTGTSATVFVVPQVFSAATWINLLLSGIATLFLIIGVLAILLRPKGTGISAQYRAMMIIAAIILAITLIAPSIAQILNYTRFYAITLLFLSPCFVIGGRAILTIIGKAWEKIKQPPKHRSLTKNGNLNRALLLIAIILSAYFLSQVGFVNYVSGGAIHTYNVDFDRMVTSDNAQVKITLYDTYIPQQDVFSATWLSNYKVGSTEVFSDYLSGSHALISYGLIPNKLLLPLTNKTIPPQGSYIYLGSLNTLNGVITTAAGSFNTSQISPLLDQNSLVYSNGNSEIFYVSHSSIPTP